MIKEWRDIVSNRSRKQNRTIQCNSECKSCGKSKYINITEVLYKCNSCSQYRHIRSFIGSLPNNNNKKLVYTYKHLKYIAYPGKRKRIFPECLVTDTHPVEFCDKYLRTLLKEYPNNITDLRCLCLPHPIYWQSRALVCLSKLLNIIIEIRESLGSLIHLIKKKYLQQYFRYLNMKKISHGIRILSPNDEQNHVDFFSFLLNKQYKQFQDENLNYGSLNKRKQGKFSNERKLIVAKRCINTGRCMIIPETSLKPNEIALPYTMHQKLFSDPDTRQWCVINRMPSLFPENFSGHKIVSVWNKNCIGLPNEILEGHRGDFDGDEMNIHFVKSTSSQLEISQILNSEKNMFSATLPHGIKLSPSNDVSQICLMAWSDKDLYNEINDKVFMGLGFNCKKISQSLASMFHVYGSKICFDMFCNLNKFAIEFTRRQILTIDLNELNEIHFKANNFDLESFLLYFNKNNFRLKNLLNDRITPIHIYQSLVSLGLQYIPEYMCEAEKVSNGEIKGNLYNGLSPFEQLYHSQSGYSGMVTSANDVSAAGYLQHKYCYNVMDTIVDKNYKLVENGRIVSSDPMRYHCVNSLLPKTTLRFIANQCVKGLTQC
jgi:RNA polymerase Rpb1, domain 2